MNEFVYCDQCGEQISPQAMFCKSCGARQEGAVAVAGPDEPARPGGPDIGGPYVPPNIPVTERPAGPSTYERALTLDALRVVAGGNAILALGAFVLFLQYASNSAHTGVVVYQLLFAVGYAVASLGWWSWSLVMPARTWRNHKLSRPFRLLLTAFAALAVGSVVEFVQLASDHARGGYTAGTLILAIGAGVIAFGFWSWAATAAHSAP